MANELIRLRPAPGGGNGKNGGSNGNGAGHGLVIPRYPYDEPDLDWDEPPADRNGSVSGPHHGRRNRQEAAQADDDAIRARNEGDDQYASVRESDAAELRQSTWDPGDLKTWLWFALMCGTFLLILALCYLAPEGQNASPPPARLY